MGNPDTRERLRAAGPFVLDGLLAAVMAAVGFALLASVLPFDTGSPLAWAAYLLVAAHTLPIAVRRLYPLPTLAWGLLTGAAFAALGLSLVALSFSILIYVYTAAARCPRQVSLAGLAAAEAMLLVVWLVDPGAIGDGGTLVIDGLIMAAAWWLGDGARRRQEAIVAAQERAAELEAAREELARRAVTEERLRIARELHDVVAHSMSIIAVQSGVGVHVLDSQPEEARKALAAVEAPAARPWSRCGGCWACSAPTPSPGAAWPRLPAWPTWRPWPPRWPGPGCGSRSGSRGPRPSCRPGWSCPPTGSSRRR
jgi:signal transduction histidine kinase